MLTPNKLWKRVGQEREVKSDKWGGKSTRVAFTAFLLKKHGTFWSPRGWLNAQLLIALNQSSLVIRRALQLLETRPFQSVPPKKKKTPQKTSVYSFLCLMLRACFLYQVSSCCLCEEPEILPFPLALISMNLYLANFPAVTPWMLQGWRILSYLMTRSLPAHRKYSYVWLLDTVWHSNLNESGIIHICCVPSMTF